MPISLSLPPRPQAVAATAADTKWFLIWHITGNPGLIDYYHPFLSTLRHLLDQTEDRSAHNLAFHIAGHNLLGFDDADHTPPFSATSPPFDLDAQLAHLTALLSAQRIPPGHPRSGQPFDAVILTSHSVGAYLTLELFHRHLLNPTLHPHLSLLRAGICLFPTVEHIPSSPRGRLVTCALDRFPSAGHHIHLLPRFLFALVPVYILTLLLRRLWGFTPAAAGTTARWLRSRDGVRQAAYLGLDELRTIRAEKWGEELWEVVAADEEDRDGSGGGSRKSDKDLPPKFCFYYAQEDHWVANELRDEFIKRRAEHAGRGGRTRTYVDETGKLTHEFCAREGMSEMVAEKVKLWIDEVAGVGP